ncbi:hypothetical protein N2152v2_011101 [Parachlorella kessleri]
MTRIAALLLLLAAAASASDDVLVVKGPESLDKILKENDFVVLELYAPLGQLLLSYAAKLYNSKLYLRQNVQGAGEGKLEPEYAKAAELLRDHEPKITLAKVDATEKANEPFKAQFKVQGFPTIKIIKNGNTEEPVEYQGPRDAAGIVKYLKKMSEAPAKLLESKQGLVDAPAKLLESKQDVDAFLDASEVAVLAYVESNTTEDFKTYEAVADQLRTDVDFGYVTDAALLDGSGGRSPHVVMHKKGEQSQPKYEGEFKKDLLKTWAESRMTPLVAKFGQAPAQMKAIQKIFGSHLPKFIAVAEEGWQEPEALLLPVHLLTVCLAFAGILVWPLCKESEELLGQLSQAAEANEELKFVFASPKDGQRLMDYFGIKKADLTAFFIDDAPKAAKYLRRNAKASDVAEFVKEFHDGALEPHIKSEEPPADNSGPVKVVTAKTFNELLLGGSADVFIEFYAPWCGHCKTLAPTWDALGEHFKDASDVIIAKMDATANDIPSPKFNVRGFPTLVFVTKAGDVIPFNGDRSKDALIKFVEEQRAGAQNDEDDDEGEAEEPKAASDEAEEAEEDKKDEL